LNFFDLWLPQIAPSAELLHWVKQQPDTDANWKMFNKRYGREPSASDNQRLLDLLSALLKNCDFSIG
jgi:uncharacterized protein YeaO (DUF488 family)